MPALLPPFTLLSADTFDLSARSWADNERALLAAIPAAEQGIALIHEGGDGIVVPRSYPQGKPSFQTACHALAAEGLQVHVRLSGGGVVPQGAGVVNLHLSYIVNTPNPLLVAEAHYQALCGLLAKLFEHFGIRTNTQTVQGSFCDGRYNLAAAGRKIAGTAQHWQRDQSAANRYRVLSHAVILAADPAMLTERANRFEQALGSATRYRADKTTSLLELAGAGGAATHAALQTIIKTHHTIN